MRSFSAKLVKTANTAEIQSRQALIVQKIAELKPILEDAFSFVSKIEIARHELHDDFGRLREYVAKFGSDWDRVAR